MRLAHWVAAHTPASAVSAARAKDRSWALGESMELASPSPPNAGVEARSMRERALRLNAERPQNAGTARTPEELPGTDARGARFAGAVCAAAVRSRVVPRDSRAPRPLAPPLRCDQPPRYACIGHWKGRSWCWARPGLALARSRPLARPCRT